MANIYPTFTAEELQQEIWKPVVRWETLYEVSNLGRVQRVHVCYACRSKCARPMKLHNKRGYSTISLQDKKMRGKLETGVHRLVAEAFIGTPPSPNHTVNHRNGKKFDNRACNLEWATHAEQLRHAIDTGLKARITGIAEQSRKITPEQVREIRNSPQSLEHIANTYGVSAGHVYNIKARRCWKYIE